jgi:nuclear pore complex protein Nup160
VCQPTMLNLYTETAFQVNPVTPASVVQLRVPRKNGSYDRSKYTANKPLDGKAHTRDEQSYSSHHLASQSSIYFRQAKSYPRTFYWRVVNNGRVLEIQCADLARSESDTKEAYTTLQFEFQDQIAPNSVAFADLETAHELHVFVCTKNEVFNLLIPTLAFRDPSLLHNDNLSQWCQPVESSTLAIDTVHRIYASSPLTLFISFASGRLQRLGRKSVQEQWSQDNYDDRTWGASIRGLMTRMPLIEYGSSQLDPRTTQVMAASADGELLFTVCLNYMLRIWHLKSGKVMATKDLLGSARNANDNTHLNPTEDALLYLFKDNSNHKFPTVLTFSPTSGQFKFWNIKGSLTDALVIEDKCPGATLSPPDPDPSGNTVWSMVGFKLDPGSEFTPAQLWVLWRNNNYHQLYRCQPQLGALESSWKATNWVKCNPTTSATSVAPDFVPGDQKDPTSNWLEFFFLPGRYSELGLETALSVFEQATATSLPTSQRLAPLRQRLCSLIAANVSLRKYGDSDMDFDRFAVDTDRQWRNFHRIVENINENRNAPLALAYDSFNSMVWIAMAAKCCAVRECSELELLQQNELKDIKNLEETTARLWEHRKVDAGGGEPFQVLAMLIHAARAFREALPARLAQDLQLAIEDDLTVSSDMITPVRLLNIYDGVGLGEGVSNDIFEKLEDDLSSIGGISGLNNELFLGVLEMLAYGGKKSKSALRNTFFGHTLFSTAMLDHLSAQRQLLTDLLTLAIFVEGEVSGDEARSAMFDASELYDQIAPLLQISERNVWLASHTRLVPMEILDADGRPNAARQHSKTGSDDKRLVTILEDTLSKAVRPQPAVEKPLTYLITDQLSEIDAWASGRDTLGPEDSPVFLQCDMLKAGELDYATEFLRFQPSTAWSSYIKGRLALAKGECEMAAYYFRKASYGLGCGKAVGNLFALSAGILSMIEAESFYNGLAVYLHHITTLFDAAKAYSEAATFAHLTLEALPAGQKEPVPNFRTDVLSRLFNAQLRLTRLSNAFTVVTQLPDRALQYSSTTTLINTILDTGSSIAGPASAVRVLQSLPWAAYPHLARHMEQHLTSLSKVQSLPTISAPAHNKLDYLAAMHAIRVAQKDYRGAVTVLHDRLRMIRKSGRARHDPQGTALRQVLLALINLMACVKPEEAYILVDVEDQPPAQQESSSNRGDAATVPDSDELRMKKRRRVIVTLDDLRKEYQAVLDKCSRIERGDFDFEIDDEDDDGEEDFDASLADHSQSKLNMSKLSSRGSGASAMEL